MKHISYKFVLILLALVLTMGLLGGTKRNALAAGTISITTPGAVYNQNFDTLAATGASTTLPNGWYLLENGGGSDTSYTANDGTIAPGGGDTYSFGSVGSAERAFGSIRATGGNPISTLGANFTNNTGSTINELIISFTGEQWRRGGSGKDDSLDFGYSLDATSLSTGIWTSFAALNFHSLNTVGLASALDGNAAGNRGSVNASLTGLNIANGASFWIRWKDGNVSQADDGLGIDDFSLTTPAVEAAPAVTATTPTNLSANVAVNANISVTFSEAVNVSGEWFTIQCAASGAHPGTVSGGPTTFTVDPASDFSYGESCTVTVVAAQVTDQDTNDPPDSMAANYSWSFSAANDIPAANSQAVTTDEDTPVAITLTATDVYPGTLIWNIDPLPAHGSLTGTAPTLTYTPDANYHGSDSFSFKVNDGQLDSNLATVAITISPVNDAPVLSAIGNQAVAEGVELTFNATATDVDLPSTLTFSLENAPAGAQIGGSSGVFTWTPTEAQGPDGYTFTVKVCDNGAPLLCDQETITVSVSEVPTNPVAAADSYSVTENNVLSVVLPGVLANDTDADLPANTLMAVKVTDPAHGLLTLNSNGSFTYTHDSWWYGTDTFTYQAYDGLNNSNVVTVTITVTPLPRNFLPYVNNAGSG